MEWFRRSRWSGFGDRVRVNYALTPDQVKNKLRTLYAGSKKDNVIALIANTFSALTKSADFEKQKVVAPPPSKDDKAPMKTDGGTKSERQPPTEATGARLSVAGLQYHINIVLPESRDQAVYDALFRALREHLG